MRKLASLIVLVMLLAVSGQAQAYSNVSLQLPGGPTYTNISGITFSGYGDVLQEVSPIFTVVGGNPTITGFQIEPGDIFKISLASDVAGTSSLSMISGTRTIPPLSLTPVDSNLQLTGYLQGVIQGLNSSNEWVFNYTNENISLMYGATSLATTSNVFTGPNFGTIPQNFGYGTYSGAFSINTILNMNANNVLYYDGIPTNLLANASVLPIVLAGGGIQSLSSYTFSAAMFDSEDNKWYVNLDPVVVNATVGFAATPEPASMLLLGSGLMGLYAARRHRKSKSTS